MNKQDICELRLGLGQIAVAVKNDGTMLRCCRLVDEALAAPRGTDAQILKERELTAAAISGAMAFGYLGNESPPEEAAWLHPFYERGQELATKEAEINELKEALRKDADRLDFVLMVGAFTMKAELDHPGVRYQLLAQDEDENFVVLSGERKSFATQREAIDAAIQEVREEGMRQAAQA
jgi:hypothetical protein